MIDTQALKKRIYDMAISGQLTRHLVDDTPVDLSLLSYQEEGVDLLPEIPETWKYCYFDDVLINRDSERIPVSVADRKKLSKKYDYYGASGVIDKVDNYLFDENLLLIGEDGANLLSRSTPIAFIAKGKYWVNNHAHVLQATEHVLLEYVEIYINAISLVPYVTGSAQPKLSQHMMSKIPVPVPPIEEQQRIVETVKSVFDHLGLIDTLQSQYQDNLATLKSKIIDAGIQGKLTEQLPEDGTAEELYQQIQQERKKQEECGKIKKEDLFPDIEDQSIPFSVPNTWLWTYLGNVSYIVRGGSPRPIKQYITHDADGINWIKIGDVEKGGKYIYHTNERIIPEGEKKSRRVYPGDFLLTNSMSFGRPYISQIEGCIHDGWLLIRNLNGFDPDYLYYLLSSSYLYGQFTEKASGSTVDNLNIDKVKSAMIPLPPLAEQKRIVAKLEELLPLCEG